MSVPPLRLGNNFDSYISGEVIIHPSAVLAPGVIVQAAPNSKVIIGSGVCVGMGSILQVDQGTLEIEAGANLGAGFLMVGAGKIGRNACIGSATTVFYCSVAAGQVVAPGSIVGDNSRQLAGDTTKEKQIQSSTPLEVEKDLWKDGHTQLNGSQPNTEEMAVTTIDDSKEPNTEGSNPNFGTHIYGKGNIQRLLVTLFPHRQSLNPPLSDDESD
jgi:carbon dioxide concentrating mechanism protein CcmN